MAARTTGRLAKFAVATPTAAPTTEHRTLPISRLSHSVNYVQDTPDQVSFPSQTPLLTSRINPNQWRMAHLYFITGWSLRALGERYNLAFVVGKLVHDWLSERSRLDMCRRFHRRNPSR